MHPAMIAWWRERHQHRHAACAEATDRDCGGRSAGPEGRGRGRHHEHHERHGHHGFDEGVFAGGAVDDISGGPFGVRRPLRYLAHKLELDDAQVAELARILNELKTDRAQVAVDDRRVVAGFADAVAAEAFDAAKTAELAAGRVKSAELLRDALVKALGAIHAALQPDQRSRLAYLIRTGALSL
jgi:Spy/CpxP family protein refolding chaperone